MNDGPTPYRPLTGQRYRREVRQGHIPLLVPKPLAVTKAVLMLLLNGIAEYLGLLLD